MIQSTQWGRFSEKEESSSDAWLAKHDEYNYWSYGTVQFPPTRMWSKGTLTWIGEGLIVFFGFSECTNIYLILILR